MKCSLLEDQNSKQVGRLYTTFERYQGVVGSVVSAVRSRKRIQIYRLTRRPIIEADIARFRKELEIWKGFRCFASRLRLARLDLCFEPWSLYVYVSEPLALGPGSVYGTSAPSLRWRCKELVENLLATSALTSPALANIADSPAGMTYLRARET
jgi:hypothetical protein